MRPEPIANSTGQFTSRVFVYRNVQLALCVLLCLLGLLRLELSNLQKGDHVLTTTVFSQLQGGIARAALPLPSAIDPEFGFDIDAPRVTSLFRDAEAHEALSPSACSGARCTYHVAGGAPEPLTAIVARPGPYTFELTQQSNIGEVHAHLALRVRP